MACENDDRNTRFANNMNVVVPKPNAETFRNSFIYQGAISWNSLPPHLKNATTHDSFEKERVCLCTHIALLYNRTTLYYNNKGNSYTLIKNNTLAATPFPFIFSFLFTPYILKL